LRASKLTARASKQNCPHDLSQNKKEIIFTTARNMHSSPGRNQQKARLQCTVLKTVMTTAKPNQFDMIYEIFK
jgi:hypothetical protein